MSDQPAPAPGITIRRRGLIAPTQALAPSPAASLSALVQSGKDVAGIAEALGVTPDEARARLDGIGLLDVVEPPAPEPAPEPVAAEPAPVAAQPTLAGLLVPAEAQPAPVAAAPVPAPVAAPAPAEVGGEASRRGRKLGRSAAPTTPAAGGIGQGWGAADFELLGRLYVRALAEGTNIEALVSAARHVVEIADRLRLG